MSEYWFNTNTRQVEEGHQSDWKNLMGPYPSRDAAERALETARANTERWDAQDKKDAEWQDASWTDDPS